MPKKESTQRRNLRKSTRKLQLQHCRSMRRVHAGNSVNDGQQADSAALQAEQIQPMEDLTCAEDETAQLQDSPSLPKCLVDLDVFQQLFHQLLCPFCRSATLKLKVDESKSHSLALSCLIHCQTCNVDVAQQMSSQKINSDMYDVNRRFVAGVLKAGLDYGGSESLCNVMGLNTMSPQTFIEHTAAIQSAAKDLMVK